jgi:hypothetical protein
MRAFFDSPGWTRTNNPPVKPPERRVASLMQSVAPDALVLHSTRLGKTSTRGYDAGRERSRGLDVYVEGRAALTHDQSGQSEVGHGTLLLADISGYTAFLQAVGEAHATDMARGTFVPKAYPLLTSLLDGIVEALAPPFVLSKLEGDAIFAFGPDGELSIRGQSVVDCLTACYGTYRARLDEARELMICDCNACVSINGLELKFVLHHGGYIVQSVAGQRELFGPDVTISHLLLKNRVVDVIGRSAYALVTDPAASYLDLPLGGAQAITEEYEHYPPVRASVLKLV